MSMRTKQSICWFSGQCPSLDRWLKDSPVAEFVTVIEVFELGDNLIHIELTTSAQMFSIITTSEYAPYPTIMSFTYSDRYGSRPMFKGDYNEAGWDKVEADMLRVIQVSKPAPDDKYIHLPDVTGND